MDSSEPAERDAAERAAARDRKRAQERKPLDNRRSVFLIARLSTEPRRRRMVTRRKRGAV